MISLSSDVESDDKSVLELDRDISDGENCG